MVFDLPVSPNVSQIDRFLSWIMITAIRLEVITLEASAQLSLLFRARRRIVGA